MEGPNARHSRRKNLNNAWRHPIMSRILEVHDLELGWRHSAFANEQGCARLTNTEHQCSEYLTPRRSLSVRFATPAIPGRSEKLLSESGSRSARGLEPVRRRFGSASVVPFMAENGTTLPAGNATGTLSIDAPVLPVRSHAGTRRASGRHLVR